MADETNPASSSVSTNVDYQSPGVDALLTHVYEGYRALNLNHLVSLTCTAGIRTMLDMWSKCLHCEVEGHNVEVRGSIIHLFASFLEFPLHLGVPNHQP
jgi:hypothetical protein